LDDPLRKWRDTQPPLKFKKKKKISDHPLIILFNNTDRDSFSKKIFLTRVTHTQRKKKKNNFLKNSGTRSGGGGFLVEMAAAALFHTKTTRRRKSWEPSPCLFHQCQIAQEREEPFFFLRQHGPRRRRVKVNNQSKRLNEKADRQEKPDVTPIDRPLFVD
jgi:hypothetical protein